MSDEQIPDTGAIWVAFGPKFLMMAVHSAKTFKEYNPERGTAIITNIDITACDIDDEPVFDHVVNVAADNREAYKWKLFIDQYTPFQRAVFLDADTEVRRDMAPVFRLLEKFPFAICPRDTPCNKEGYLWGTDKLSESGLREFNSGVFAYDLTSRRATDFFERLRAIFQQRHETVDQPSFMAALYEDPSFPFAPLSVEWNATNRRNEARAFVEKFPERIGVYHYREPLRHLNVAKKFIDSLSKVRLEPSSNAIEEVRGSYTWPMKSPFHMLWYHVKRKLRQI